MAWDEKIKEIEKLEAITNDRFLKFATGTEGRLIAYMELNVIREILKILKQEGE